MSTPRRLYLLALATAALVLAWVGAVLEGAPSGEGGPRGGRRC